MSVPAPTAGSVVVHLEGRHLVAARADDGIWSAEFDASHGEQYWICVDDGPPLLDPSCRDLVWSADGPRSVAREEWPVFPLGRALTSPPVVYEMHVRGFGRTYRGCIEHLDRVAASGANVIELMPVHPFDDRANYWGYMPLVWGAVHRPYAVDPDRAAEELADLVGAAHARGLHVWLDVVFNHTGEGDTSLPTYSLRGLDDEHAYRHHELGRYTNDSGCGNDIDPANPYVRHLVLEALDRFVRLGIDGFRFDLASLLTRDGGDLVRSIGEWGRARGVTLIAEPWDMGSYQVGSPVWPNGWLQWNDRFRDDVRGFLRGEPGLVPAIRQRVQGSPDLFGHQGASLNFVTAHDGLTMHDLTVVTSDRHRSWDCGPELRLQQLRNYFTVLLLSVGTPMWVMGDEFGRSQDGHDNPHDIDGPLTWVDWTTADGWRPLTDFVHALVQLRRAHPPADFVFHGVGPVVDESFDSRSIAWCSGDLYVMVNAWWEPLTFEVHEPGDWRVVLTTAGEVGFGTTVTVAPRSIVVLTRG
ncbi:MAG: alpha-amylase family glycosyl hydrolase [Actinomycetota bacterium]